MAMTLFSSTGNQRVWRIVAFAFAALLAALISLQSLVIWGYAGQKWQLSSFVCFVFALPAVLTSVWFSKPSLFYLCFLLLVVLYESFRYTESKVLNLLNFALVALMASLTGFATMPRREDTAR